jgi:drug/metabolite transporter (DMT)-like permease
MYSGRLPKSRQAEISLIAITVIWGLTFSLVKKSLAHIDPFVFMSYRFTLAFLVMGLISVKRMPGLKKEVVKAGVILGILLYASYAFQTFGLKYTTAGNAGFITGLFVVFTPILSAAILRKTPSSRSLVSVAFATVGLALLTLQTGFTINKGDPLVLACAFCLSLHIIYMDRYVKIYDVVLLTLIQMGVLSIANTVSGLIFEDFIFPTDGFVWFTIIVCGVFASALAFYVQGWAQRYISPVRTSVVLIMEPVFSVFFGIILLSESLSWRGWLGCALILAAMLITEIKPESRNKRGNQ